MNEWEQHTHQRQHSIDLHTMATTGAFASSAMHLGGDLAVPDNDALLEALVFMDDLDLDATDAMVMAPSHSDGILAPMAHADQFTIDTFDAAAMMGSDIANLIPATAYVPDSYPAPASSSASSMVKTKPPSPPTSVTSSASPPTSPTPSSDSSVATNSVTSGGPKGVVNRSRNRRREELVYLRGMVTELEGRLTTLQTRAQELQEHQNKVAGDDEEAKDDPVLSAVWEDLAVRQYAQRQRAETENIKLRRMLEEQIQVGKSLERLLKRRNNAGDDLQLGGKRPRRSSVALSWNDTAIFDELLAVTAAQYAEADAVLGKINFDRNSVNFRDIQVRNDPDAGVMVEVVEANVLPFDYDLTVEEMFTMFLTKTEHDRYHYHDAKLEQDVLKVQFGMTVEIPRAKGEFNLKIVSRRYREANRTVMVWAAFCDPMDVSDTNMDGIYMRHRGWTVVEPLMSTSTEGGITTSKCLGTKSRSFSTAVPEAFADVPDQKRKVGTLTNFILTTTDIQMSSRLQLLENRLVEVSRERAK